MDTQEQCVVKIKIYCTVIINLLYIFFPYKNKNIIIQTYCYVHVRPYQMFRMILATECDEEERLSGANVVWSS